MAGIVALGVTSMCGVDVMDRSGRHVDGQRDGGDADLDESTMERAQAGNNARRDPLASQLSAGAAQSSNAAATADESPDGGGSAPVILQASTATQVQQFRWQRALGECGAFLWGEELAGEVIGLRSGMNRARDDRLLSGRRRTYQEAASARRWPGR
jgi:hypothetical protein